MSPEQINIAIAEACGWKQIKQATTFDGRSIIVGDVPDIAQDICKEIPDYYHDLNAMHEAEASLGIDMDDMAHRLWMMLCFNLPISDREAMRRLMHATAAQRAEAFLRTIGKWEEETE